VSAAAGLPRLGDAPLPPEDRVDEQAPTDGAGGAGGTRGTVPQPEVPDGD